MKKAWLFLIAGMAWAAGAAQVDGIAATVDGADITIGDVMREMHRHRHETFEAACNALIERKLVIRAAAEKKMEMQEWVVDNRIREIVHESFGDDRHKLDEELRRSRVPMSEWRDSIREDMIVSAMQWQFVDKNLIPTPGQMREEYEKNSARYVRGEMVSVRVILLRPAEDGKTPSVKTRADEILERLAAGADFAELARKYSADSHAKDGGLWKDVNPRDSFRAEVADAIAAIKVGNYSGLIMLDGWGFIVKKEAATGAVRLSFNEAYNEIVANVRRARGRVAYADWIRRLKQGAYIKIHPVQDR